MRLKTCYMPQRSQNGKYIDIMKQNIPFLRKWLCYTSFKFNECFLYIFTILKYELYYPATQCQVK